MNGKKVINRELKRQNTRINLLKGKINDVSAKVGAVLSNQRHYLRHRAPGVLSRNREVIARAESLLKRFERIPKISIKTTYKCHGSDKTHIIFMCTPNEARKLRAILSIDFRQFNARGTKGRAFPALNYSCKPRN